MGWIDGVRPAPIAASLPSPVDNRGLVERLRLTGISSGQALLGLPVALVLGIVTLVSIPLTLALVGVALAWAAVPATEVLTRLHRRISGGLLDEEIPAGYVPTDHAGFLARPLVWLRDPARWRDFAFLWFSATGGFVMSVLPVGLLVTPVIHLVGAIVDGGLFWWLLVLLAGPLVLVWWVVTPYLARARANVERAILGHTRVEHLARRVEEVAATRTEALDHNAAEIRRIERDLHDGAQTQMLAVGMNVGMAEKLLTEDPEAAAQVLDEARQNTLAALASMRALIRGIHPPALAERGLVGGIEAMAYPFPVPIERRLEIDGHPPAAVESAMYFAVAECLTNVIKHASPDRAWVSLTHTDGRLRAEVGDDGVGGADPTGSGLDGVRRRLSAFDGTITVTSPPGGPTVVTLEVPCELSSRRTRPFSGSD